MFDFIGYFHTCCCSFLLCYAHVYSRLYSACVCRLFDEKASFMCPRFFLLIFLLCVPIIPSYFVITHQLLHKQSLKYFMSNERVVSLCTPCVYRGFSTASDYVLSTKFVLLLLVLKSSFAFSINLSSSKRDRSVPNSDISLHFIEHGSVRFVCNAATCFLRGKVNLINLVL
jgi:hypothetical protein